MKEGGFIPVDDVLKDNSDEEVHGEDGDYWLPTPPSMTPNVFLFDLQIDRPSEDASRDYNGDSDQPLY